MTRNAQSTLQRQLRRGGALPHDEGLDKKAVVDAAHELGLALFVANCDPARSRSAVLRAIVKAVDFPEYFGGNLDALYDCLCDTVLDHKVGVVLWLYRLHSGDPALEEDAARIEAVLPTRPSSPTRMAASLRMWSSMRAVIPIPNRASLLRGDNE